MIIEGSRLASTWSHLEGVHFPQLGWYAPSTAYLLPLILILWREISNRRVSFWQLVYSRSSRPLAGKFKSSCKFLHLGRAVTKVVYRLEWLGIFIDGGPKVSYRRLDLLIRPAVLGMITDRVTGLDVIVELSGTRGWDSARPVSGASHTLAKVWFNALADNDAPMSLSKLISDVVFSWHLSAWSIRRLKSLNSIVAFWLCFTRELSPTVIHWVTLSGRLLHIVL